MTPSHHPDDYGDVETNAAISKNRSGMRLTGVVRQYAPRSGDDGGLAYDGHFVAFNNPTAKRDVYRFLDDLAKGLGAHRRALTRLLHFTNPNDSEAAATVFAMSSGPCAALMNAASNCDGGQ